jgi:lysine-ketoglutarate reductase/saccharopine dehydrogenase-like protein (TIGR00300 family)
MYRQDIELRGHIIDSMILPKIMDQIMDLGANFEIKDIRIGRTKHDPSYALISVEAATPALLEDALSIVRGLGAEVLDAEPVLLEKAPGDGLLPTGFYSTTNLVTLVRLNGTWVEVEGTEMDCAVVVDLDNTRARCVPLHRIRAGDNVVVGKQGIRVRPIERARHRELFSFMGSRVSPEHAKGVIIEEIAREVQECRQQGGRILAVVGPAVIHTGGGKYLARLIESGFINCLFAGNALATHDIEQALYGTSLGVRADGSQAPGGHCHHLRAINRIRQLGGIKAAVEQGVLRHGVMYTCVKREVPYVLAGSIRDDGPLPEVITDSLAAQDAMRAELSGVRVVLMLASMLHSIATGNLLPAHVRTVCVDINPSAVTKLTDRGSFQAVGLVSDVEWFLRELYHQLVRKPALETQPGSGTER